LRSTVTPSRSTSRSISSPRPTSVDSYLTAVTFRILHVARIHKGLMIPFARHRDDSNDLGQSVEWKFVHIVVVGKDEILRPVVRASCVEGKAVRPFFEGSDGSR
jgi:hypothetical protein